jgi:hypothetical protein
MAERNSPKAYIVGSSMIMKMIGRPNFCRGTSP